jgi:hypothetical protein
LSKRWTQIQTHLFPSLCAEFNSTLPKLEKLIHILKWIQPDQHLPHTGQANGRPTKDRLAIGCSFVAKALPNLDHLGELITGHLSRDATAINAREKPVAKPGQANR